MAISDETGITPAKAQARRTTKKRRVAVDDNCSNRPVDFDDPTDNVRELFKAESLRQDGAREYLKELVLSEIANLRRVIEHLAENSTTYQNAQVASETRRIDQLAKQASEFAATIRDMLAESVRTTSQLVANQLTGFNSTFDGRVSKLEAGAFTQAGKSSVSDPAMVQLAAAVQTLSESRKETNGQSTGQDKIISYVLAIVGLGIAAAVYLSSHSLTH
jgi:hypothetical protein